METSTTFKVSYTKVKEIHPHPNPEVHSLEIATVYGFQVVSRKGTLKVGDLVLFCPVDSILPEDLESIVFPPDSKIKLSDSRVRQARIQRFPSQGLLLNLDQVNKFLEEKGYKNFLFEEERDYKDILGIRKYEPPVNTKLHVGTPITSARRLAEHPDMHGYNGLENIKWYPDLFSEEDDVEIQLKLHGTNARMGNLKTQVKTRWQKFLNFFGLLPKYHFRYGSNNVDITAKGLAGKRSGFYGSDIYGEAFKACNAEDKIEPNELIFGEIIGEGIQKGYHYGHKTPQFVLFDVKVFDEEGNWKWLTPEEVEVFALERGFQMVPVLYRGKYSKQVAASLVSGADPYYPAHKVREGIVIKAEKYNDPLCSSKKKALKFINPEYLDDRNNSDFH